MSEPAREPDDLERLFLQRANAGDVEGLLALYEPDAVLDPGDGRVLIGRDRIRAFFVELLAGRPRFASERQAPALRSGDLALTSSRSGNGDITAEIARRQPDGTWRWIVDHFAVAKSSQPGRRST
jgi:uncharacterized protein (TIGR02246 family)